MCVLCFVLHVQLITAIQLFNIVFTYTFLWLQHYEAWGKNTINKLSQQGRGGKKIPQTFKKRIQFWISYSPNNAKNLSKQNNVFIYLCFHFCQLICFQGDRTGEVHELFIQVQKLLAGIGQTNLIVISWTLWIWTVLWIFKKSHRSLTSPAFPKSFTKSEKWDSVTFTL